MSTCAVDDCDRQAKTRGWCNAHYENWRRNGNPLPQQLPPLPERLLAKVHPVVRSGCWRYAGYHDKWGYATITARTDDGQKTVGVYRVLYEHLIGPVPAGLHLDHLCRNRWCVNPSHLEPVTKLENDLRGMAARTHCKRGHAYTPQNTYWQGPGQRSRVCITCRAEARRRREGRSAA